MKKCIRVIRTALVAFTILLLRFVRVAYAYEDAPPVRVNEFQNYFGQALGVAWALTIPYFMFVLGSIGFKWMTSAGDEQKLGELKKRGGNILMAFVLVFGGWLVVSLIINLLGLKDPGQTCFGGGMGDPFFQIFFPNLCS